MQSYCESIQLTVSGITSGCQWACHQFLLNALACPVFWSPPRWYTIEGAALLAFMRKWHSRMPWALNPTCTVLLCNWDPSPAIIPGDTDLPPCDNKKCAWTWQFVLGTCDAPTRCLLVKILGITPHCDIHILSERSEGGQPLGQRITRQLKSNHLTLGKDKTCSWRGQFELGNT